MKTNHKSIWILMLLAFLISCNEQTNTNKTINEYLIAYNISMSDTSDNYDVWIVDPMTLERKNITNNPDVAWTYLAYENKVYFISDRDSSDRKFYLYEMDANGNNVSRLTDFRLRDSWMGIRDGGKELIVNPHPSVDSTFWIIDNKGNKKMRVPIDIPAKSDPAFSPDGSMIAFRGGTKASKLIDGYHEEVYTVKEDGSGLTMISNYPKEDTTASRFAYKAGPPRWHPTEGFISFHSYRNGKYSLYGVNPESREEWKLTNLPDDEGWHEWSSDGNWLAIETFANDQSQFHITLMNWETKETKVVTDTSYKYQQAPVFVAK